MNELMREEMKLLFWPTRPFLMYPQPVSRSSHLLCSLFTPPVSLTFLFFLKHDLLILALRSLHRLFPLANCPSPDLNMVDSFLLTFPDS